MIKIDKEFEALIPPLSPEEFAQLEENCVRDGIRDPLVVWHVPNGDDILIDGHNRWKIAAKHGGMHFEIERMEFDLRDDAKAWMLANQLGRRNLNTYNRSLLALELKPLIQKRAKERQGTRTDLGNIPQKSAESRDEVAKFANVSHDTIRKVEVIERDGSDYIKEKVRSGDITINKAYLATKGIEDKSPARVKKEFIDRVEQEHEDFQHKKVVSVSDVQTDRENRKIIADEYYSKLIKAGNGFNSLFVDLSIRDASLEDVTAGWDEAQRENIKTYIHTWMQELKMIWEVIN